MTFEKENNPKILLLATTSFAGMGPYVASIINAFNPEDEVCFFLVEDNTKYYSKNIKEELRPYCKITQVKMNKFRTLLNLTIHPKYFFHNELKKYCMDNDISVVHCLTSFHDPKFINWFSNRGDFVLTIHDLYQHESNKAKYKEWRQNVLFIRMSKSILSSHHVVTNSISQYNKLKQLYPDKTINYIEFPTLITSVIENGRMECPELRGIDDYILFFGRIEDYKGLSLLTKAFLSANIDSKLVIAGKGDFAGKINHENIIYINRYINDEEIGNLYRKAKYVVYPYISATQSGVLSIASFFKKPMVLSDIPFFKETIGNNKCSIFFETNNTASLREKLVDIQRCDVDIMAKESERLYTEKYSQTSYRQNLLNIYSNVDNKE